MVVVVSSTGVELPGSSQWRHVLEETVLTILGHLVGLSSSDEYFILLWVGNRTGIPERTLSKIDTKPLTDLVE